jgi:uncharacterized membrane protein
MPPEQNTQVPPSAPVPPPISGGANNDMVMGILSYLGILILIPLLVSKNRSVFLNYHLNQGLSLIIVSLAGYVILTFVGSVLFIITPIWNVLMLILVIMGIINVTKNEMKPLPIIGGWFKLIK